MLAHQLSATAPLSVLISGQSTVWPVLPCHFCSLGSEDRAIELDSDSYLGLSSDPMRVTETVYYPPLSLRSELFAFKLAAVSGLPCALCRVLRSFPVIPQSSVARLPPYAKRTVLSVACCVLLRHILPHLVCCCQVSLDWRAAPLTMFATVPPLCQTLI